MFNSPLQYCTVCKQYVELDQSVEECAGRHGCEPASCPLARLFAPPVAAAEDSAAQSPAAPVKPG